VSNGQIGILDS